MATVGLPLAVTSSAAACGLSDEGYGYLKRTHGPKEMMLRFFISARRSGGTCTICTVISPDAAVRDKNIASTGAKGASGGIVGHSKEVKWPKCP